MVNNMGALIEKMQQLQEELKDKTIEISEGGGSCRILINGHQEVRAVHIERALLAAGERSVIKYCRYKRPPLTLLSAPDIPAHFLHQQSR